MNPTVIKIKKYIAFPKYPAKIIELVTKIIMKFLVDTPNLAQPNEINSNNAKINSSTDPKK